MEKKLFKLHFRAAKFLGSEKVCRNKIKHPTEEKALRAMMHHNEWDGREHDVEIYPCPFCNQWHLGGIWPTDNIEKFLKSKSLPNRIKDKFKQMKKSRHVAKKEKENG
ncbi:MAG: hypothetical protein UT24_C0015G0043 [Candidatus Woesebacteria bacterium GW2011_GWB1_39_12]|uniref:Uncharacterized protein n=1 Tax=Candidatus Woesebacteria bacterium GW2011_GWB1_39_12 TaxID=1618574 RepID=A0A0G0PPZ3_9BACT|nr:MAG: hypothetical protein UT24_C0015G0043 [Candidatus Woesebacteria bacterium GW2011_GWB1_39_12]